MSTDPAGQRPECPSSCGCGSPNRRQFLKITGLGAAGLLADSTTAMAGPFTVADFDQLVPADKKLSPQWVKGLTQRGTPTVYRGEELRYIGVPVGGICAGQLYLGGDGRLWHWDIFNQEIRTGGQHYAQPPAAESPVKQGFALRMADGQLRPLDATGFPGVAFRGEYPIGTVEYRDEACPLAVKLEAFSPFIPLNAEDSSLPVTVLHFTLRNVSAAPVEATLVGSLENAVLLHHREAGGARLNRRVAAAGYTFLEFSAEKPTDPRPVRPDVLFEDWNKETYDGWTVAGEAFGRGPVLKSKIPAYQGDVGGDTARVVNSHATAPGRNVTQRDNALGKLTSRPFTIERRFVRLWVGGGNHAAKTCVNVVVGGKVVRSVTGPNNNRMGRQILDLSRFEGHEAVIEIVDAQQGPWGNIGVGRITFTDRPEGPVAFESLPDNGTMGLALLGAPAEHASADASAPLADTLAGELGRAVKLAAGESAEVTFVVAWHFPNLVLRGISDGVGRHYASRFTSASAVVDYVVKNFERLDRETRLWRSTWYDSSLPFWFLDRTLLNASILASSTCHWFADGRFYGWEGVGCCAGTCTHVWHYAHSAARLFPELERILRERVDFGLALLDDGAIRFRGEANTGPAADGQAGSILRAYREHQMSADDAFLKRNWAGVKKALQYLIHEDGDGDGILAGSQHNTLDANWFGPVAWLSGLYLAALRAGEEMAREVGDEAFARQCQTIFAVGTKKIVELLFEGEYFINRPDPAHPEAINSGSGCEIDQVMGQSWAFQVGLGRVLPQRETLSALRSLWRYNFTPDAGPFRAKCKPGRWYAMAGEAGLLMCTFPRRDWDFVKAAGRGNPGFAGYFNECMNGFEHQVAGHMIWEGMLQEGLAIERALDDRYHASRRNPWNEVECGDHYARSMASHGVFLAACGFEYHGPKGQLSFVPRLGAEEFKAAFTAAEGWGSIQQRRAAGEQLNTVTVAWGKVRLTQLSIEVPPGLAEGAVQVTPPRAATPIERDGSRIVVRFQPEILVTPEQPLVVKVTKRA
jgi:hypothetical protein